MPQSYLTKTNYFLKDEKLPDPCVDNLNPAEKEIAHILGIPGGLDSMGTLCDPF